MVGLMEVIGRGMAEADTTSKGNGLLIDLLIGFFL